MSRKEVKEKEDLIRVEIEYVKERNRYELYDISDEDEDSDVHGFITKKEFLFIQNILGCYKVCQKRLESILEQYKQYEKTKDLDIQSNAIELEMNRIMALTFLAKEDEPQV